MADRSSLGPKVVAIGGGHGLSTTLRAVRTYAGSITAIGTVADDGGSSGRLRRELGILPPGDLRRALVALAAEGNVWADAFEHRFEGADLDGHALGNLVLVALTEALGDFVAALDEAGRLLGACGRVLPSTVDRVVLEADVDGRPVVGQVAVATALGRIARVGLEPPDARAVPDAVEALRAADQVVLGPGSLFTSVLAVLVVPALREAREGTAGRVVLVGNVCPDVETASLDAADHLAAVLAHGGRVDTLLAAEPGGLGIDPDRIRALGSELVAADVADPTLGVHDERRLAPVLAALL